MGKYNINENAVFWEITTVHHKKYNNFQIFSTTFFAKLYKYSQIPKMCSVSDKKKTFRLFMTIHFLDLMLIKEHIVFSVLDFVNNFTKKWWSFGKWYIFRTVVFFFKFIIGCWLLTKLHHCNSKKIILKFLMVYALCQICVSLFDQLYHYCLHSTIFFFIVSICLLIFINVCIPLLWFKFINRFFPYQAI